MEKRRGIKDDAYVSSSSPGGDTSRTSDNVVWSSSPSGDTGAKSAVSDCILFINWHFASFKFVKT